MGEVWGELSEGLQRAFDELATAFGAAVDKKNPYLVLRSDKGSADIEDKMAVEIALVQLCQKVWVAANLLNTMGMESESAKESAFKLNRIRLKEAATLCESAILTTCSAGLFGAAMTALDYVCPISMLSWNPSKVLSYLTTKALHGPRFGWTEPLTKKARLDRLAQSPWWGTERPEVWDGGCSSRDLWTAPLAALGKTGTMSPELSPWCLKLSELAAPLWLANAGSLEHAGRELAAELSHLKIKNGALDIAFWQVFPLEVRLGIALGVHGESKLGSWCCSRIIEDGVASNRLPEIAAGIWCSFERSRIDMLESVVKDRWTEQFAEAMNQRLGSSNCIMEWCYLDDAWDDKRAKRAKWACLICERAGIEKPKRAAEAAKQWTHLVYGLHAVRQAKQLKALTTQNSSTKDESLARQDPASCAIKKRRL